GLAIAWPTLANPLTFTFANEAGAASFAPVGHLVSGAQFGQPLADPDLEAALDRLVKPRRRQVVRPVAFTGREGIGLVVGIAIALAVVEALHQRRRRIAQAQRHRSGAVGLDEGARRVPGAIDGIALRRHGEIDDRLGQRQLAFGRAEPLVG